MIKSKLYENKIEYTPEKLEQLASDGEVTYKKIGNIVRSLTNKIENSTVGDIMDNPDQMKEVIAKVNETIKFTQSTYEKFYDIVEMYDFFDRPKSVDTIDKLSTKFDYLKMDLDAIKDVIESLLDGAKYLKRLSVNDED